LARDTVNPAASSSVSASLRVFTLLVLHIGGKNKTQKTKPAQHCADGKARNDLEGTNERVHWHGQALAKTCAEN